MPSAIDLARSILAEAVDTQLPQGNTGKFKPETDDILDELTEAEDPSESEKEEEEEEVLKEASDAEEEETEEEKEELTEDVKNLEGDAKVDESPEDATRKQFNTVSGHQEKAQLIQKLLESAEEDAEDEEQADKDAETLTEGRKPKLPAAQHAKVKSLLAKNKAIRQKLFRLRDKDGYDSAGEEQVRKLLDTVHQNRVEIKKLLGQPVTTKKFFTKKFVNSLGKNLANANDPSEKDGDEEELLKETDSLESEVEKTEKADEEAEKIEQELTEQVLIEGRKPKLPAAEHARLKRFLASNKAIRNKLHTLRDKDGYDSANEDRVRQLLNQVHANRVEINKLLAKAKGVAKAPVASAGKPVGHPKPLKSDNDPSDEIDAINDEDEKKLEEAFGRLVSLYETTKGDEDDETFREKAKTVFETVIDDIEDKVSKNLKESYQTELGLAQIELQEAYEAKLDGYLDYVVEKWFDENKVGIESSARVNLAEQFIGKLQGLLAEHNIAVPDNKDTVVRTLAEEVVSLETENKKLLADTIASKNEARRNYALYLTETVGAKLSDTDKEKFTQKLLSSGRSEDMRKRAPILVESFTGTPAPTTAKKPLNSQLLTEGLYDITRPFEQADKPGNNIETDQVIEYLDRMGKTR